MKNLIRQRLKESLLPEATKGGSYTLFHGSPTQINSFSDDFVGGKEAVDQEGPGIYFTTSKEDVMMYGGNLYTVNVNPNTLYDEVPINANKLRPVLAKLTKMAPDWKDNAQNFDENPARGLQVFVDSSLKYNSNEKDALLQVWYDFYRYNPIDFVRNCVKMGIDGIIVNRNDGIKHVIIYNPSIIKIAN